jgi:hypothetical protein
MLQIVVGPQSDNPQAQERERVRPLERHEIAVHFRGARLACPYYNQRPRPQTTPAQETSMPTWKIAAVQMDCAFAENEKNLAACDGEEIGRRVKTTLSPIREQKTRDFILAIEASPIALIGNLEKPYSWSRRRAALLHATSTETQDCRHPVGLGEQPTPNRCIACVHPALER